MPKTKTLYVCQSCGNDFAKWMGKCPTCDAWNSFSELRIDSRKQDVKLESSPKPISLAQVSVDKTDRILLKDAELNRVLGGGMVRGSIILLGGEPGIGKSTLALQLTNNIEKQVLYVSGEESSFQIKMRSNRLNNIGENCLLLNETNVHSIIRSADDIQPELLIIDSIQTLRSGDLDSAPGTVSQVRECTAVLQNYAKSNNLPVVIIGHINKEGAIAGPKVLEHIVDVVLLFSGDRNHDYRLLRTTKNRFGSTDEMGVYEMTNSGLIEINNPSQILLEQNSETYSGSAIAVTLEGRRPLLVEVQALVSPSVYGIPQRTTTGYDVRRLQMMLAVLEKRAGFKFGLQDVFLNVVGGIKLADPAVDLAVISALISSLDDFVIKNSLCFVGEIGLSGELRSVNHINGRISEADRLGFERILIPNNNMKDSDREKYNIDIVNVLRVGELYDILTF